MPQKSIRTDPPEIQPSTGRKIRQILISWGKQNYQDFPWRSAEQPWHALLAEVLLQRTRAKNVVPVYLEMVSKYKTPDALGRAPLKRIEKLIYPLGLKWRAPWIKALGKALSARNGEVPDNLNELLTLPGVGPYAASAWISFHGKKRGVIVDANVVRFICRLVGQPMDGETRRKKWLLDIADLLTPRRNWKEYNYAVLDFTMQICMKSPRCHICPIGRNLCIYGAMRLQA